MDEYKAIQNHPKKLWFFDKKYYIDAFAKSSILSTTVLIVWGLMMLYEVIEDNYSLLIGIGVFLFTSLMTLKFFAELLGAGLKLLGLDKEMVDKYKEIWLFVFLSNGFCLVLGFPLKNFIVLNLPIIGFYYLYFEGINLKSYVSKLFVLLYIAVLTLLFFIKISLSTILFLVFIPMIFTLSIAAYQFSVLNVAQLIESSKWQNLRAEGIQFTCHTCMTDVEPIHCYCPSCNQKHRQELKPNEYGIFHHNCTECNHRLPTSFAKRHAQNMELYCPTCEQHVDNFLAIDKHVVFVENQFFNTQNLGIWAINLLKKTQQEIKQPYTFLARLNNAKKEQSALHLVQQNNKGGLQFLYQSTQNKLPYQLHFYEIQDKDSELDVFNQPFLKNTQSICFEINTYQKQQPLDTLRSLIQALEKYKNSDEIKAIPFNIILSQKVKIPLSDRLTIEQFIKEKLDGGAFVHHVKQQFEQVNYYAVNDLDANVSTPILEEICTQIDLII